MPLTRILLVPMASEESFTVLVVNGIRCFTVTIRFWTVGGRATEGDGAAVAVGVADSTAAAVSVSGTADVGALIVGGLCCGAQARSRPVEPTAMSRSTWMRKPRVVT